MQPEVDNGRKTPVANGHPFAFAIPETMKTKTWMIALRAAKNCDDAEYGHRDEMAMNSVGNGAIGIPISHIGFCVE